MLGIMRIIVLRLHLFLEGESMMVKNELLVKKSDQDEDVADVSSWFKPLSQKGIPVWLIYLAALLSLVYLLNPTAGTLEIIPDFLPIIGNLDEGVASVLLWYGLVELFEGRKYNT
jgi:uncharacterized membrane protein YkvA (DUF1232 family)